MRKRLLLIAAGLLWPSLAFAQTTYKQTVNGSQPATVNIGTLSTKCVYSGTTSLVVGQAIPLPCTVDGKVAVDATVTATASIDVTAIATPPATAPGSGAPLNSDLFGGLWMAPEFAGQLVDGTHGLPVDCITGCGSGTFNNNADSVATSSTNGQAASWPYVWNGATWDRISEGLPNSNSAHPIASQLMVSDNTNLQRVFAPIELADGVNGNNMVAIGNWFFNGTTWDRVRGDVTNGEWVNVKTSVLPTGAATSANQSTIITDLGTLHTDLGTLNTTAGNPIAPGTNLIGNVGSIIPAGATAIQATATGTTGATTATLAGTSGKTTYVCGFSIRANATAAATANSTVTGLATSPVNFTQWTAPNASGIGLTEQVFMPCQPASATNTGIAVISAAPGTGGVVSVTAWGYQL